MNSTYTTLPARRSPYGLSPDGPSMGRASLGRGVRAAAFTAFAALAALALTACGGGQESGGEDHGAGHHGGKKPAKSAGAADVAFAQGMIPHHRQALEMSELAASRAESARVKSLSERIAKAQKPEIDRMSGWLKAWGEKVPAGGEDHSQHGGHSGDSGHSEHSMPGMMTSEDMAELKKTSGEKFDRAFLRMMTAHHEGAVTMARTEESDGSYAPAKDMAREIRRAQTREIAEMRGLLKK